MLYYPYLITRRACDGGRDALVVFFLSLILILFPRVIVQVEGSFSLLPIVPSHIALFLSLQVPS